VSPRCPSWGWQPASRLGTLLRVTAIAALLRRLMPGLWLRQYFMSGRVKRVLWKLGRNLDRHDAARAASAMAFDAFLSLIPLLAMAGYVLGRLHRGGSTLAIPVFRAAPGPVARLADAEFLRMSDTGAAALAPVSVIAFVWVGSAGISTAMGVCETAFAAEARPWWRRRAIAMGCVIASVIAIPGVTTGLLAIHRAAGADVGPPLAFAVASAIVVGALWAFYRISIRRGSEVRRRMLPGALVAYALWGITSVLFSTYVRTMARYTTLYGSLAAVAMLLFWLWLLALAVLVGGEVNAELEGVRNRDVDVPSAWRPSELD
jgi:membrane protein